MHKRSFNKSLFYGVLFYSVIAVVAAGILSRTIVAAPQHKASAPPPAPAQPAEGQEVATFAGGCFWSMEAMFKQLKGVASAEPGYAGGRLPRPAYEQVLTGMTGHAETVNIIYDPKVISYRDLLHVFLTVHDPTTLNRQGPDEGTQYRSVIFYRNEEQKKAAQEVIREATTAHVWNDPIVTAVTPYTNFYRAEDYHVDYYNLHRNEPYCRYVVAPKIKKFKAHYKSKLKS